MKQYNYYVYLLTSSENSVFYVGVTNDLIRRVIEHKIHRNDGFTNLYNVTKLVYFETFSNVEDAIKREKQVKRYKRLWKVNLVNNINYFHSDVIEMQIPFDDLGMVQGDGIYMVFISCKANIINQILPLGNAIYLERP